MAFLFPSLRVTAVAAQIGLTGLGLAAAGLAPPAHGAMLAVPLFGTTAGETIDLAVARGATVEGRGAGRDWIVIRGDRARLGAPLRAHGILLLAAPSLLCAG